MTNNISQFKCYVCYSVVDNIPYCGECEITLPNGCRLDSNASADSGSFFSGKLRSECVKCSDCQQPSYCAHTGSCLTERIASTPAKLYSKNERRAAKRLGLSLSELKDQKKIVPVVDEDADLIADFENVKVVQILKAGISKRRKKRFMLALSGEIDKCERQHIFERDGYACLKCGTNEFLTIDHIIPLSKGGTNTYDNKQTLCGKCNNDKADTYADYRRYENRAGIEPAEPYGTVLQTAAANQ